MNTQPNPVAPVDEADDWEPPQSDPRENQKAIEAFAIQMGIPLNEPRIKPNRWLGENDPEPIKD